MHLSQSLTERLIKKERLIITTGLMIIIVLAWWFIFSGANTGMNAMQMTIWQFPPPSSILEQMTEPMVDGPADYWASMLLMWWIMMIAMMVPSAAPVILLYARVARHNSNKSTTGTTVIATGSFALGYLTAWFLFSVAAVLFQWLLGKLGLFHNLMMWSSSSTLSASLFALAGIYQLSPLKLSCLKHCRSPAEFIASHWADGVRGALRMGLIHGLYCVGCCWFLMALLFVGGVMNLIWIAGLAILVLIEKLLPAGFKVARISGVSLLLVAIMAF